MPALRDTDIDAFPGILLQDFGIFAGQIIEGLAANKVSGIALKVDTPLDNAVLARVLCLQSYGYLSYPMGSFFIEN